MSAVSLRSLCAFAVASLAVAKPAAAEEPIAPQPSNQVLPPGAPPAVPNPSPVVLAGKPTPPDTAAVPLRWKWERFSTADYVITVTGAALTLGAAIVKPRKRDSSSGILFDEDVRDAVRPDDLQTRYLYRDASDVGLSLLVTWPFFADALTTAWWYRGSRDVAEQMALINLETLAISGALQGVTNVLVGRERPYGRHCGEEQLPEKSNDCDGSIHYRSFFSGHSSFSFTSAALICVHHFKHELLGPPWDGLSCAASYAVAASTASFRVVSDVHYTSDVITGALVGTLVGYGVPLFHYSRPLGDTSRSGVRMQIVPSLGGAAVLGTF